MQLKLEHLILSLTDEISMVGYKKFQCMNQTMCAIKGTTDGDWGNICVLVVGDLYQLPPVGQRPIYMAPQTINTLSDFAPNGWEKMQLHELTQTMRQKDQFFAKCLNAIRTSVPESGSTEDIMLQQCELRVSRDDPTYPRHAMHVYAHNDQCDEWNYFMLQSLPGSIIINTASDTKKDHFTQLANVLMPEKPHQTGNLRKVLQLKVGAIIMVTSNIDVSDGLTNGARGTITNIITHENQQKIQAILVQFDNEAIGEEAKKNSKYKNINKNAVPIVESEVSFPVKGATSFNVTRRQFPLTLAWAVTIHKCQGLTLPEIVVDMSPNKGTYQPGQAYVAFSRVRELSKLHIVNYTRTQIKVSKNVGKEMERLRTNVLPQKPQHLFQQVTGHINVLHINIANIKIKMADIQDDDIFKYAHVISINETYLSQTDKLTPQIMHLTPDFTIFRKDRNNNGGGVALIVNQSLSPELITIDTPCEVVVVKMSIPTEMVIMSTYRPPSTPIHSFTHEMSQIITLFNDMPVCVIGDFNEDILLTKKTQCCTMFRIKGFKQMVTKPTRDTGTLIDHIYTNEKLHIQTDVSDCYYSDHDYVLCTISKDTIST